MKKTHFLKFAVLLTSFAFFSCGDDDELPGKTERPEEPGDVATGVYGCSDEQKKNMEDIPGMGEIVETALGENGTYIYSDRSGNTCTLNKDGDMEMHGKDGSVTTRDHTIHQSTYSIRW